VTKKVVGVFVRFRAPTWALMDQGENLYPTFRLFNKIFNSALFIATRFNIKQGDNHLQIVFLPCALPNKTSFNLRLSSTSDFDDFSCALVTLMILTFLTFKRKNKY
jgi:hypothetical protein